MSQEISRHRSSAVRRGRRGDPRRFRFRKARLEQLEPRFVLSAPTLAAMNDVTVLAGAPLNIALNGFDADGDFLIYSVTSSNPALTTSVLDPLKNRSMKISVDSPANNIHGDMVFQLFEELAPRTTSRIIQLAQFGGEYQQPFYNGLIFHRVIKDFMIQGGDPKGDGTGGSGTQFDDEFSPQLQFTGPGLLAMAKSSDDTNDSQFFITSGPTRWLDFQHSIFGFLTKGDSVREQIENVPVVNTTTNKPVNNVVMTSVDIFVDEQNRTLRLSAPQGTTGTSDVTVTVWDGDPDNQPVSQTFHVTIQPDTNNDNPFLGSIAPIEMTANTPTTVTIPATDVEGDAMYFWAGVENGNTNLTVSMNSSTGQVTLTPKNGFSGVTSVIVAVRAQNAPTNTSDPWDSQYVPVYVKPAAPTVTLLASSDTGSSSTDGITNLNNTLDKKLSFRVSGTVSGAVVVLFADGTEIGRATASGDSVIIQTNGTVPLTDGAHAITVKQTLRAQTVDVGNLNTTVDLASAVSSPLSITVDATIPQITSSPVTTATEGVAYLYDVQSSEEASGVTYQLTTSPAGMIINSQTGVISWTPGASQGPTQQIALKVTDAAGNFAIQSFQIQLQMVNTAPVANSQQLMVSEDTAKQITLTGNDGDPEVVQVLTYTIVTAPTHGTLSGYDAATGQVTGTLTYTPNAGYVGTDSFTFTVTDDDKAGNPPNLTSAPATVAINVVSVNHPPVANAQSVTTDEDAAKQITLTGDDGEPTLTQVLTFQILTQPSHGKLTGFNSATGAVLYTPDLHYNGTDTFTFRVIDDASAGDPPNLASTPATVTITINPVNNPPTANAQNVSVLQNVAKPITLTGNGNDPELTEPLTFTLVDGPSHGTLTGFDPATGAVVYTPNADYSGSDSFTFTVTEQGTGRTSPPASVALNVAPVNARPIANPQAVTTDEDAPIAITLTGDDGDPEVVQTLRFTVVRAPSHGTLSGFDPATGRVTYVPEPYYSGTDSFAFVVTDDDKAGNPPSLTSAPATVTINLNPVDHPPLFTPVPRYLVLQSDRAQIAVRARDLDVPSSPIQYSLESGAPQGVTIDPRTGDLSWQVPQDYPVGTVRLAVRATKLIEGRPSMSSVQEIEIGVEDLAIVFNSAVENQGRHGANAAPAPTIAPSVPAASDIAIVSLLGDNEQPAPVGMLPPSGFVAAGSGAIHAPTESLDRGVLFGPTIGPATSLGSQGAPPSSKENAAPGEQSQPSASRQDASAGHENEGPGLDKRRTSKKSEKGLVSTQDDVAALEANDAALEAILEDGAGSVEDASLVENVALDDPAASFPVE